MRLVLDTNTVLALWMFEDPALAALRAPCEAGRARLLGNAESLDELSCVLAYAQFKVAPERAAAIHAEYAARLEQVAAAETDGEAWPLPRCEDKDDQKFLELARDGRADFLITRDRHLLKLARRKTLAGRFVIITPEKFIAEGWAGKLQAGPSDV